MGYAAAMYGLVTDHDISDTDDDQLYYTLIYLNEAKRVSYTNSHMCLCLYCIMSQ